MGPVPTTPEGDNRIANYGNRENPKTRHHSGLNNELYRRQSMQRSSFLQTKGGGFGGFNYSMRSSNNSLMMKMNQQQFSFANDRVDEASL
jgi:hypothetical protein